jgi:group I intron endonuclease
MPYKYDHAGIYKIVNTHKNECYVGQSVRVLKRISDHRCNLRKGTHSNPRLQNAWNKYKESAFVFEVVAVCEDYDDLDTLENAFISGDAYFDEPVVYNIADFAKTPMRGRAHSTATIEKIRLGRNATSFDYSDTKYRARLKQAQMARFFADPEFVDRVRYIINNDHLSYADRARHLGRDISSTRRLALKYMHMKGTL